MWLMISNFDLSVRLLLTFLVNSDNENSLRYASARKCKHLLSPKKRRLRGRGSCDEKRSGAAFFTPATSSPLKKPLTCGHAPFGCAHAEMAFY